MKGNRLERVNSEIKKILLTALSQNIFDIDTICSISKVNTTPDISTSHIYISYVGDKQEQENVLRQIKKAGSYLRGEVSKNLNLRITPRLEFHIDDTENKGKRIDELLSQIKYSENKDYDK